MLGPNPRKAATPSTANPAPSSSGSDSNKTGDGLMVSFGFSNLHTLNIKNRLSVFFVAQVKAIDDIFRFVEASERPQEFRVSLYWNFMRQRKFYFSFFCYLSIRQAMCRLRIFIFEINLVMGLFGRR